PGSPWENPFVESFGSREVLSVEAFDSVFLAQTLITDWRTISTTGGHTAVSARDCRRPMALTTTSRRNRPDSHSGRTDKRGPVRRRERRDRSMQPPRMLQWSVSPESSSHDQLESWGLEGRSMPQKLMAHVVARAQFALL